MSLCRVSLVSCLLLASVTGTAFAQGERPVGLVMGVPVQVGILWHAAERVAVRPDVSFSWSSSEFDASSIPGVTYTSAIDSTRVTTGISVLLYLTDDGELRTYVAPRYTFSRSSASTSSDLSGPNVLGASSDSSDSSQTTHSGGGLFGASYAVGSRFAIFGEVGLDVSTSSSKPSSDGLRSAGKGASTRGGVGVVVYF